MGEALWQSVLWCGVGVLNIRHTYDQQHLIKSSLNLVRYYSTLGVKKELLGSLVGSTGVVMGRRLLVGKSSHVSRS
jgi:hypothetical protein